MRKIREKIEDVKRFVDGCDAMEMVLLIATIVLCVAIAVYIIYVIVTGDTSGCSSDGHMFWINSPNGNPIFFRI